MNHRAGRSRGRGRALWVLVLASLVGPAWLGQGEWAEASRIVIPAAGPPRGQAPPTAAWRQVGPYGRDTFGRVILVYDTPGGAPWTAERLRYYIAHVRPDGTADGWFFDTVLFLALASDSQRSFCPGFGNEQARAEDWLWYLDQRLFGGNCDLAALEEATRQVCAELRDPRRTVRVIIVIPYPDEKSTDFGSPEGRPLDLSRGEDRVAAVRWYMREVAQRWSASNFEHLRLVGFYWVHEAAPEGDRVLLEQVYSLMGKHLLPLYWIPYFGASGNQDWDDLGFDIAIQQPNYYFYDVPPERLREAAALARRHGMGVELELDRRVLTSPERRARYQLYLEAGGEQGYQDANLLAWYDDMALLEAARSADPEVRRVYEDTYAFVRGARRPQ